MRAPTPSQSASIGDLPKLKGRLRKGYTLSQVTWFRVGGPAEFFFKPEDQEDLKYFLKNRPHEIPITFIGVGSNLLVRDGGIDGVVIRLGKSFAGVEIKGTTILAGAAALDLNVALASQQAGLKGLEFLSGIPGTIGGALRMNAGAYGKEVKDVLLWAEALSPDGDLKRFTPEEMGFSYRSSGVPEGWIFVRAAFACEPGDKQAIAKAIQDIQERRADSQPIRARTGGSTFKNPPSIKAWQAIDEAGCRGLQHGDAMVSEKHCNFLINTGNATAQDLETLGTIVQKRVKEKHNIELEWEIKRIGKAEKI